MSIKDILKKSFLEGWASTQVGTEALIVTLLVTLLIGLYIFAAYRVLTRRTFYSNSFNISLVGVSLVTATIILTIQSSIVVSLGMVGALSIVRFRTAVKDPLDLMFLYWAISVGIVCGAGLAEFAVVLSLVITLCLFILEKIPVAKAPLLLVVSSSDIDSEEAILKAAAPFCRGSAVKARNLTASALDLTVELRSAQGSELVRAVMKVSGVQSASLISHDGEATF